MSYESTYGRRRRQEFDPADSGIGKYLKAPDKYSEEAKFGSGSIARYLPETGEEQ